MRKLISLVSLGLALSAAAAQAATYSELWGDATVTITYPDQVTYNTAFGISFSVDSSTMTTYDAIAFLSDLTISNTVNLDNATWAYAFTSGDPNWNWNFAGAIGDFNAELTSSAAGHKIAFIDPIIDGSDYTWLWRVSGDSTFNDKVTWTVGNMIIQADTTFSLKLDDSNITNGPTQLGFTVLDPPAALVAVVPEPATYLMMLLGLAALITRRQPLPAPILRSTPA